MSSIEAPDVTPRTSCQGFGSMCAVAAAVGSGFGGGSGAKASAEDAFAAAALFSPASLSLWVVSINSQYNYFGSHASRTCSQGIGTLSTVYSATVSEPALDFHSPGYPR
jgi:hypothetical protein